MTLPAQRTRASRLLRGVAIVAIAGVLVGQLSFMWRVATNDALQPEISDFGRDLIGVEAVRQGLNPYQTLGNLQPERFQGTEIGGWWVAHPPAALAQARLMAGIFEDRAEDAMRWLTVLATLVLGAVVWRRLGGTALLTLAMAAAVVVWYPALDDLRWVQANALVALALFAVLTLSGSNRRTWALALLGLIAAFKLWPAIFVLGLPGPRSALKRHVAVVAGLTAAINLLVLPLVGGWSTLKAWPVSVLANNAVVRPDSLSVTSSLPEWAAVSALVAGLCLFVGIRHRLPVAAWPFVVGAVYLTLAPISWGHYMVVMAPPAILLLASGLPGAMPRVAVSWMAALSIPAVLIYLLGLPMVKPWNFERPVVLVLLIALVVGVVLEMRSTSAVGGGDQRLAQQPSPESAVGSLE